MMRSLILKKVAQGIIPILVLFAVYLLLRGHNEPGGGFIAGLVIAAAIVLQALAFGTDRVRAQLAGVIRPSLGIGLFLAVASGLVAVVAGDPFLTQYHWHLPLPGGDYVHLSTTLLFDIGVFMVVIAASTIAVSVLSEAKE